MLYDEELKGRMIEALDGSEVWAVKSAGDTTDTVYLHHWDVEDGQETFETFSPVEAMALAIELMRASGAHAFVLERLEDRLKWTQIRELTNEFYPKEIEAL